MTISDWAIVLATLVGPILAVQAQKFIERLREKRNAKLLVFRQLMATRAARLSAEHVQALNMIDVVFYDVKTVREAWKALFASFCRAANDQTEDKILAEERDRLTVDLLHTMAESLGYDFDRTHIKNQAYTPQAHGDIELEANVIRRSIAKMLVNDGAFRLKLVEVPAEEESQRKLRETLVEMYQSGKPWPVKIVGEASVPTAAP